MTITRDILPRRKGFSIIEATLAVILIGTAMVAALNVAAAASRTSASATQRRMAERLAHYLMSEIMTQPASRADATSAASAPRLNNFDHVLDYQGLRERPPTTADGTPCAPAGWEWSVDVTPRGTDTIEARAMDLRMYVITVTVELPNGTTISTQALRGNAVSVERVPVVDHARVVQVPVSITLPDGHVLRAAPQPMRSRPPEGGRRTVTVR
ncbi:MAG: hypothetical protein ACIAS6_06135 [Phycisphaerales bacterium JB060]